MKVDLVVFDLAGTTVHDNYDVHKVLQHALQQFNIEISIAQANAVMGIPKPVAIRELLTAKEVEPTSTELIDSVHSVFVENMIKFYNTDASVSEKEGATEVFTALKQQGVKVIVDTGFDRPITDAILARFKWKENGLIDGSVCSDEVAKGRPHPDMIIKAMELADVKDAGRVAKVGDTASDLHEGTSAGCGFVIGITSGAFTREALEKEQHTHLINSLRELPQLFAD